MYWIFDNIAILRKIGILSGESKSAGQKGSTFWLLALLFTLIQNIKTLISDYEEMLKLETYIMSKLVGILKLQTIRKFLKNENSTAYAKRRQMNTF